MNYPVSLRDGRITPDFPNKCMYDAESSMKACRDTGFEVGVKAPFQSRIDRIETVEIKDRTEHAVVVEGVKDGGVSFTGGAGHD